MTTSPAPRRRRGPGAGGARERPQDPPGRPARRDDVRRRGCAHVLPRPIGAALPKRERAKVEERRTSRRSRTRSASTATCLRAARRRRQVCVSHRQRGLPAYDFLVEGYSQALDNDVVLSMKQANVPAVEPLPATSAPSTATSSTKAIGQLSASVPSRCTPTPCTPSWTSRASPRCRPTRSTWPGTTSPSPTRWQRSLDLLGRATAKIHCASDEDSDQDLVDFQVEEAIVSTFRPSSGLHRPHRRLRHLPTPTASGATTRCSWRRSATARSGSPRPSRWPASRAPGPGSARMYAGRPQPRATNAVVTAACTAATRCRSAPAMAEPRRVSRAPAAPDSSATSTVTSSSSRTPRSRRAARHVRRTAADARPSRPRAAPRRTRPRAPLR